MALPEIIVDSLDTVDESETGFFEDHEGKFKFNYGKYAEAQKAALLKKNSDLIKRLNTVKPIAEKFKDFTDDDLTAYQEWKAAKDDGDGDGGNGEGKLDKVDVKKLKREIQTELKKDFDAQLKLKDDAIAQKEGEFTRFRFKQELTTLVSGSEDGLPVVLPERLTGFMSQNSEQRQFGFVEGKLVALDSDGEPDTETVNERIKKLAEHPQWKFYFAAKEAGGGSGADKSGSRKHSGKLLRSKMSTKEKSDYIKEHGNDAYLKLPLK